MGQNFSWIKQICDGLNNNDTEIPEDQLEDQALQLDAKDFVSQAKAKAKPQRRELAGFSSRMTEGIGLILNRGNTLSLSTKFRRK